MRSPGMWFRVLVVGTVLTLGTATVAAAQGPPGGRPRPTREQMKARMKNATPEQKAYAKALMTEQKLIRGQVKAGTLDRKSAAETLKAWRKANPAPKKAAKPIL